jgi:hypothetical protein
MPESKLEIELRIMTTLHGWTAPEHATIEITETQLIAMLRAKGWTLPIHDVMVIGANYTKMFNVENEDSESGQVG